MALVAAAPLACSASEPDQVAVFADIADPWQPEPFAVDASVLAAVERACAAAVKPRGLPLVAVDVRGASRAMLVYAGPRDEADCLADIGPTGAASVSGGGPSSSSDA